MCMILLEVENKRNVSGHRKIYVTVFLMVRNRMWNVKSTEYPVKNKRLL